MLRRVDMEEHTSCEGDFAIWDTVRNKFIRDGAGDQANTKEEWLQIGVWSRDKNHYNHIMEFIEKQ